MSVHVTEAWPATATATATATVAAEAADTEQKMLRRPYLGRAAAANRRPAAPATGALAWDRMGTGGA